MANEAYVKELVSLKEQLKFDRVFDVAGAKNIVIAGMGGSGIAGMIFQEIYSELPVYMVNDYHIPNFVDKETLFVAISYSGNTEETLSAYDKAAEKGAKMVAITSGGALASESKEPIIIPQGLQPRAALGYMIMPLLKSFGMAGNDEIGEAYDILGKIDAQNEGEKLIAEEIAMGKKIPVIYGVYPYKAVAYRWKTQFNENSKVIAYSSSFPELNHNDTMALKNTYKKSDFYFFCLSDNRDSRMDKRIKATEEITDTMFRQIGARGKSRLSRIMSMVHIGDYITFHLAGLLDKDPLNVTEIEELKLKLKE